MAHFTVVLRIEYARAFSAPRLNHLARTSLDESVDAEMTARGFVRIEDNAEATTAAFTSNEAALLFSSTVATIPYRYVGDVDPRDVMGLVARAIGLLPFNISVQITTETTKWHWIKSAPQELTGQSKHGGARRLSAAHVGATVADAFARILLEWCIVLRAELTELPFAERDATAVAHFSVLDGLIATNDIRQRLIAHARTTRGAPFAEWLERLMARGTRMRNERTET